MWRMDREARLSEEGDLQEEFSKTITLHQETTQVNTPTKHIRGKKPRPNGIASAHIVKCQKYEYKMCEREPPQ